MFGYAGKLLYVDLAKNSLEDRLLSEGLVRAFLGGRGIGAALLYKELKPGIDPLSPDNVLVLMTCPATGTLLPACSRWEATTKSPLTNTYLCSSAGGFWGAELKFAGYDGIIIRGKAAEPAWLTIIDGKAELHDASELWGLNTEETCTAIRKQLKDPRVRVACIGQAGENLIKFACIQADTRSLGRGGAGAVMGSKQLKAIAVRGRGKLEVADEGGLITLTRELVEEMKRSEAVQNFTRWGTPQFVDAVNESGLWPTRNFQDGVFEGATKINAKAMREQLVKHDVACYACPIACAKQSVVIEGKYAGTFVEGPEYETIWSFGAACGVDRLDAIAAANMWCDRYGMDTISCGSVIAWAMECYERGLLESKDVDGLELKFGNHEAMVELIHRIAFREGVGNLLAEGVHMAARKVSKESERFAMGVKGLELAAYDPRGAWGMALAYATACRGGCHLKAWTLAAEVFAPTHDRFSTKGKAKLVFELQNKRAVVDSLGVCVIGTRAIGLEEMVRILEVTVGLRVTQAELLGIGERIYNLERLLAVREGTSRKDDTLPPRIFEETLKSGPAADIRLERVKFESMLDEYYELRDWDRGGKPTETKLKGLGIPKLLGQWNEG